MREQEHPHTYPAIQIRSKAAILYSQHLSSNNKKRSISLNQYKALRGSVKYTGTITKGAKKRIRKAVELLLMCSPVQKVYNPIIHDYQKFRLTFITLTIPLELRLISVEEGNKALLQPFLEVLRKKYGVFMYVWKAELQERGQLHYHLTTNVFILHDKLKQAWNKVIEDAGMMNEYKAKFGHCNPNSTDIHAVYKVKNIGAYLVKYLIKNIDEAEQETEEAAKVKAVTKGKVWGCSSNLSKAGMWHDCILSENEHKIDLACTLGKAKRVQLDNCTIIECSKIDPKSLLSIKQLQEFNAFINTIKT